MSDRGLIALAVCGCIAAACIATGSAWPIFFLIVLIDL
jgi:hypothetical protein